MSPQVQPEKLKPQIRGTAPYFLVKDIHASVDYYHRVLGFTRPKLWGDPPSFAMPCRDGFIVMLKQAEAGMTILPNGSQRGCWDAYFWIEDADALFNEMKANGAVIEYEPCFQDEYDMKELAVRDPDGHILAFGQHWERED
jgi:uncharacterized glyoxalase superfamily protein PhnB